MGILSYYISVKSTKNTNTSLILYIQLFEININFTMKQDIFDLVSEPRKIIYK